MCNKRLLNLHTLEKINMSHSDRESVVTWDWVGEWNELWRDTREIFKIIEITIFIALMVYTGAFVKTLWNVQYRYVPFIIWEKYFNKDDLKEIF